MGRFITILAVIPLLSGCAYDYLQHTDRIAYSAGDAVHANLEAETVNPSKRSMYDVSGLYGIIPTGSASGDLDCKDVGHPVNVSGGDPNHLDADHNGIGCQNMKGPITAAP